MADVGAPTYPRGVADDDTSAPLTASAFHAEPGTEGWHVLYGGAQTIFPTGSFAVGAALVARIIEVTAPLGREPDIDLRPDVVAVVTAVDRRGRLTTTDAEVARRVSVAAAELGLHPDAHTGVEAWRVLFTGAHAHWHTASLHQGGAFVAAIADAVADLGRSPDVDLRPRSVVVRTSAPEFALDEVDVQVAQRVSAAAAALGLAPDPAVLKVVNINVARTPGTDVRPFWNAALGYRDLWDSDAVDPNGRGPQLAFNDIDRPGRGRTHIDVSVPAEVGAAIVERAVAAGGRLVDERPGLWWTLASPENHGVDIAIWPDLTS